MRIGKKDTAWVICLLCIIGMLNVTAFSGAGETAPLLSLLGIGADGFREVPSSELKTAVHIIMLIFLILHNALSMYGTFRLDNMHAGYGNPDIAGIAIPIVLCVWNLAPEVIVFSNDAVRKAVFVYHDALSTYCLVIAVMLPAQTLIQWSVSRVWSILPGEPS